MLHQHIFQIIDYTLTADERNQHFSCQIKGKIQNRDNEVEMRNHHRYKTERSYKPENKCQKRRIAKKHPYIFRKAV